MKLTENFNKSEFECKCGCYMPYEILENVKLLAIELQKLRDYVQRPVRINSAYRCKAHNKAIGGVSTSQHILGKAADIKVSETIPIFTKSIIESLINKDEMKQGGLGLYNTFVHYDIRGTKARWDFRVQTT